MKKPHIIYIVADQLRYDMLGKGFTPNIDAIGAEGAAFHRAYCASPLCVPARGALFTGTYPNVNGSLINPWFPRDAMHGYVHAGMDNLYKMMERGGWECIHSGKQHFYTEGGNLEEDPDTRITWASTEKSYKEFLKKQDVKMPGGGSYRSLVPEMTQGKSTRVCLYSNAETGCYEPGLDYYFDGYFTDMAISQLRRRNKEMPLFLSAMFLAPHPPLEIPEPFYSAFSQEEIELPGNVGTWYPYQSPLQMYNLTGMIGTKYTREQWKETWRVYKGLVKLLDDCVGRLIDELKAQGLYDDCLIIFTSDHGEMLGSHRLFQKMCMYEESVRTPVYIKFPKGIFQGISVEDAVSHVDIQPTLCEYLDIECGNQLDGRSLLPLLNGSYAAKPVFIQFDGNGARGNFQRCILEGKYKLIADIFKDEVYYELYDVCKDPQETNNLLFEAKIPEIACGMLERLMVHMERTGDMIRLPSTDLHQFVSEYRDLASQS